MNKALFTERLVALCNGDLGLRSQVHVEAHEPAGPAPSPGGPNEPVPSLPILDFIASDESLDRHDEVISASGWRLSTYQRNPVFQNSHQYGDILFTLGKALSTEVRNGKLIQRVQFATDVNPMAKIAYGLYKGKFLNAVSVGFIPIRWENGTEHNDFRRKFVEQELLEVSAVAIPANPNALTLAYKSGAVQKADLRETLELLRETLAGSAPKEKVADAGPAADGSALLQIACEVRELLRR
jgi:HK97 family phage prohead protease